MDVTAEHSQAFAWDVPVLSSPAMLKSSLKNAYRGINNCEVFVLKTPMVEKEQALVLDGLETSEDVIGMAFRWPVLLPSSVMMKQCSVS